MSIYVYLREEPFCQISSRNDKSLGFSEDGRSSKKKKNNKNKMSKR